jgi:hypothetical protein
VRLQTPKPLRRPLSEARSSIGHAWTPPPITPPVAPEGLMPTIAAGMVSQAKGQWGANTDLLNFLDASVSFYLGHGSIAGTSYGADEAGAQATAQSERTKPVLVANRFHAISQASMMSARLRNTELASQWLRR